MCVQQAAGKSAQACGRKAVQRGNPAAYMWRAASALCAMQARWQRGTVRDGTYGCKDPTLRRGRREN